MWLFQKKKKKSQFIKDLMKKEDKTVLGSPKTETHVLLAN